MARPGRARLPATLDRADVTGVVAVCLDAAAAVDPVRCDARSVAQPRLPTVDAIARIALVVRRDRRTFRLEHASPQLLELLDLCGLTDCLTPGEDEATRPP